VTIQTNSLGDRGRFTCLEICAGAGGQALGLEQAGFEGVAHVELDRHACETLRLNRPAWQVIEGDVREFCASGYAGVDLLAGGVPCPPFSKAGKQLGRDDERDLFPEALRLVAECRPRAVLLENVRGFLDEVFAGYREWLKGQFGRLGYGVEFYRVQASDFGVPQLRPRVVVVGFREGEDGGFELPMALGEGEVAPTVGLALRDLMGAGGWEGAAEWARRANRIAPTLVGGSKKHGGADLGPSRAKRSWAELGVDGRSLADGPPPAHYQGMPRLTLRMAARVQGFPDEWEFAGGKTAAYRQIGNAFPPPVARAIGKKIMRALEGIADGKCA
jgi:DNA (cytosine-5)-methyltransferase 1